MFEDKIALIKRCIAVAKKAQKPTEAELRRIAKVSGLLMITTGLLGVVISFIFAFI